MSWVHLNIIQKSVIHMADRCIKGWVWFDLKKFRKYIAAWTVLSTNECWQVIESFQSFGLHCLSQCQRQRRNWIKGGLLGGLLGANSQINEFSLVEMTKRKEERNIKSGVNMHNGKLDSYKGNEVMKFESKNGWNWEKKWYWMQSPRL